MRNQTKLQKYSKKYSEQKHEEKEEKNIIQYSFNKPPSGDPI